MKRILWAAGFGGIVLTTAVSAAAQVVTCSGDGMVECRDTGCSGKQTLYSSLTLDYRRSRLEYCIGEGCYTARVTILAAAGEDLLAFHARRSRNDFHSGLVTIHPGRKAATVGQFLADGTVAVNRMHCDGR
ncbi:MAG: hypothetical protein HY985_10315 [Magnetospirillum sp.]|nr:hypothetical protein [Magnetospirillum sp.]